MKKNKPPEMVLRESGEILYGSRFQTALAKSLGVDRRTIINWLSQAPPASHPMWTALEGKMRNRVFDIQSHRCALDVVRGV